MPFTSKPEPSEWERAYERGQRKGLLKSIEVCLEIKFGPQGRMLLAEIQQIQNNDMLEAVLDGILPATTLDDLRRVWSEFKEEEEGPRFPWHGPGRPKTYSLDDEEVTILKRLIRPEEANLSVSTSRDLLKIGFDRRAQDRMQELAKRVRENTLTAEERAEIGCYERVGYLLFLLHDKARRSIMADGALP